LVEKIPNRFGKIATSPQGGFFDSHCRSVAETQQQLQFKYTPKTRYQLYLHEAIGHRGTFSKFSNLGKFRTRRSCARRKDRL